MPMRITITITDDDIALIRAIDAFTQTHGRTPKKREVVTCSVLDRDYKGTRAARVFERLKLLGLVDHNINGHCTLTAQGKHALEDD